MTEAEYHLLVAEQMSLISTIWEYWLASTFAFIVAFHAGRKSITKPLAWIGCTLYSMAAIAAILRYVRTVAITGTLNDRMLSDGIEPLSINVFLSSGQTIFSTATFVLGTIAAVWYAVYQFRKQNDS